ncbi:hypothetical protein EUTSA_v10000642mg [Eutrema salsugineum]|uniref:Uncharacterized protein n=1 Tax=Eutrema salsugineum TaxID=72664 RepID=V4LQK2_EUTSA|nr:hypothetical protein EUTSA_v10000642mg [Eutrema salsugineum]
MVQWNLKVSLSRVFASDEFLLCRCKVRLSTGDCPFISRYRGVTWIFDPGITRKINFLEEEIRFSLYQIRRTTKSKYCKKTLIRKHWSQNVEVPELLLETSGFVMHLFFVEFFSGSLRRWWLAFDASVWRSLGLGSELGEWVCGGFCRMWLTVVAEPPRDSGKAKWQVFPGLSPSHLTPRLICGWGELCGVFVFVRVQEIVVASVSQISYGGSGPFWARSKVPGCIGGFLFWCLSSEVLIGRRGESTARVLPNGGRVVLGFSFGLIPVCFFCLVRFFQFLLFLVSPIFQTHSDLVWVCNPVY